MPYLAPAHMNWKISFVQPLPDAHPALNALLLIVVPLSAGTRHHGR